MNTLRAAQRLQSMAITRGDNYGLGQSDAEKYLESNASDYKILNHHESQALLAYDKKYKIIYVLVELRKPFDEFAKELKAADKLPTLYAVGAKKVLAHITVWSGVIASIWVDKSIRGQGYGKALYNVAYQYSKKGIESSDDLGTFSLATWLSLYKRHKAIYISSYSTKIPRSDIVIDGLVVIYKHSKGNINLTKAGTQSFTFVWPK